MLFYLQIASITRKFSWHDKLGVQNQIATLKRSSIIYRMFVILNILRCLMWHLIQFRVFKKLVVDLSILGFHSFELLIQHR